MQLKIPNQETANTLNAPLEDKAYDNVDQLFDDIFNEKIYLPKASSSSSNFKPRFGSPRN